MPSTRSRPHTAEGQSTPVHYTILRQHDRRELQNDLMDVGATSLATTESLRGPHHDQANYGVR